MINEIIVICQDQDLLYTIEQNIISYSGIDKPANKIIIKFALCNRNQTNNVIQSIPIGMRYIIKCHGQNEQHIVDINKKCIRVDVQSHHLYDVVTLQFQSIK